MTCGECNNWMAFKCHDNIGCCIKTSLNCHKDDGDHCTIAEPKPKELRDGDVIIVKETGYVLIRHAGFSRLWNTTGIQSAIEYPHIEAFNLLDLAAAVREGGTILIVPKGEFGVSLTKETINEMLNERFYGHIRVGASKGFDALRQALEAVK